MLISERKSCGDVRKTDLESYLRTSKPCVSMKRVVQKLGLMAVGVACCAAMVAPSNASAAGSVNQLKFLQTLAQLSGDSDLFSAGSQASAYVDWAHNRGLEPAGGWKPTAKLTS